MSQLFWEVKFNYSSAPSAHAHIPTALSSHNSLEETHFLGMWLHLTQSEPAASWLLTCSLSFCQANVSAVRSETAKIAFSGFFLLLLSLPLGDRSSFLKFSLSIYLCARLQVSVSSKNIILSHPLTFVYKYCMKNWGGRKEGSKQLKRKGGQSGNRGPKTKEGGKKDKWKKRGQIGGTKQVQERAGMNQKRQKHNSLFLGPSSPPPLFVRM